MMWHLPSLVLALMAQSPEPIPIYVGPNVRDGFVDIDAGVQDSINDLREELRKNRQLRVTPDATSAVLKLYVTARSKFNTGDSVFVADVAFAAEGHRVETILRVGDYERVFTGESESRWKSCADSIAEDLAIWLNANRERLERER